MTRPEFHVELIVADTQESRVRVSGPGGVQELWIRSDGQLEADLTAWLPMLTPIAMGANASLSLHGPVDQTALAGAREAQRLLHSWYSHPRNGWCRNTLHQIDIYVDQATAPPPGNPAVGTVSLFSGGVDAFHTAQRHATSHLLFVHGFDIPLSRTWLIEESGTRLAEAADEMGRRLVQASTNVRELADRYADWGYQYHGAATAGIAIAHAPMWGEVWIASSHPPAERHPWASHPELDGLWSSSRVRVGHDAAEWERSEKLAEIVRWPVAMRHLRVCWQNLDGRYNCGRCEKCVRTMIGLHMLGALERCETLPHDLTRARIVRSGIVGADARGHARTNVRELRERGDEQLAQAVTAGMLRGYVEGAYLRALASIPQPVRAALRTLRQGRTP